MKRFIITLCAVLTAVATYAVPPKITAALDRDSIMIGDRFTLTVKVDKDMMQVVEMPEFDTTQNGGAIEIVRSDAVDTLSRDGRRMTLVKKYTMTSFAAGKYDLGKIPVLYVDKNIVDTLYSSNKLLLEVTTYQIDTAKQDLRDIKAPLKVPVRFGEFSGWLALGLLGLVLLAGIFYIIIRLSKHKPIFGKERPAEPPHVRAIRELDELHNQKLWQNGKHKLYYTRLTEILREYLHGRFGVSAMEMTTDEILDAIKPLEISDKHRKQIADLLRTADYVKFAKHAPESDENEAAYLNVYYFVEETKIVDPEQPNTELEEAMKV